MQLVCINAIMLKQLNRESRVKYYHLCLFLMFTNIYTELSFSTSPRHFQVCSVYLQDITSLYFGMLVFTPLTPRYHRPMVFWVFVFVINSRLMFHIIFYYLDCKWNNISYLALIMEIKQIVESLIQSIILSFNIFISLSK